MVASRAAAVMAVALFINAVSAQYGSVAAEGGAFERGSSSAGGATLTFNDITLPELKGVWRIIGSQQPESAFAATENNTLPDCASDNGQYSYGGLDTTADQFLVLAGTGGVNRMNVNLQRSTFAPNVTYNNSLILQDSRGTTSCTHFVPYVDLSTGELMAESIGMTQWATNSSSGSPSRTSLNCQVTGSELPGCYTGQVSRAAASAPSVAIASIALPPAQPRSDGSIVTVTRTTYQCGNGECIRLAPKYARVSPVYGG